MPPYAIVNATFKQLDFVHIQFTSVGSLDLNLSNLLLLHGLLWENMHINNGLIFPISRDLVMERGLDKR